MADNTKTIDLTKGSEPQILFSLTMPTIAGLLAVLGFNIVDTFFVAKLGADALAAMSFTFPVVTAVRSLVTGLAIGSCVNIAMQTGKNDPGKIRNCSQAGFILVSLIAIITTILGILFESQLFKLMGADNNLIPLIKEYMIIWFAGSFFIMTPMFFHSILRSSGEAGLPNKILTAGIILNIILDPILIFGYGFIPALGIKGAAIATIAAQIFMFIWFLVEIFNRNLMEKRLIPINNLFNSWVKVLNIGFPSMLSKMSIPVAFGVITGLVAVFGSEAVAAYGVVTRIESILLIVVIALSMVIGPFIGQNLGANQYQRIKTAINHTFNFSIVFYIILAIILIPLAIPLIGLFTENQQIINIAQSYLYIIPVSFGFIGITMIGTSVYNIFKKAYIGNIMMVLRMFILFIPLAILLSKFYGLTGIFIAAFVSNILSGAVFWYSALKLVNKSIISSN